MKNIYDNSGSLMLVGQRLSFLCVLIVFSTAYSNQVDIDECMSHLTSVVGPENREDLSIATPVFNFIDGISEVAKRAGSIDRRMILISVYGHANAGKSHFITGLMKELSNEETSYFGLGGATNLVFLKGQMVRRYEWDSAHGTKKTIVVFHCAWNRCTSSLYEDEDPNILLEKHFNRGVNINIGIHNPNMLRELSPTETIVRTGGGTPKTFEARRYDLIIQNPDSQTK